MRKLALPFLLVAAVLSAQNPTAVLVGTVTDPAGSVVEGASVEVRNAGTNELRKTQSDVKGEFTVAWLRAPRPVPYS